MKLSKRQEALLATEYGLGVAGAAIWAAFVMALKAVGYGVLYVVSIAFALVLLWYWYWIMDAIYPYPI